MLRTDEVDEQIMQLLRDDGRLSNREVARRLEISEGTVRQRLKKLEDAHAIRMGIVVDPFRLGVGFTASIMLAVEPSCLEHVLDALARLSEVSYVASITGQFNVFVLIVAQDIVAARSLIDSQVELAACVHRMEVRPVLRTPKHDYHLIAIPHKKR